MHKGFCFYSRQYVLRELRKAIRKIDADVVFLQEVMGVHPEKSDLKTDFESQFEYLSDQIWPHFAYGKNAIYNKGHHGNAILSKYPIVQSRNINASTNAFEKRGFLNAKLELEPGKSSIHIICLHLDLLERGRKKQIDALIHYAKGFSKDGLACIIAGDFNDWLKRVTVPISERLKMEECGVKFTGDHVATFPSWRPMLALDRVYMRGFRIHDYKVLSGRPWSRMSDHAAVMVDLEWLKPL